MTAVITPLSIFRLAEPFPDTATVVPESYPEPPSSITIVVKRVAGTSWPLTYPVLPIVAVSCANVIFCPT